MRVEEAVSRAAGKPWKVRFETDLAVAAPAPPPPANGSSGSARPKRAPKEEAEKTPLVKRAVEVLGATIQRVEEGFGDPAVVTRQPGGEEG
jgi:hypothetical protein